MCCNMYAMVKNNFFSARPSSHLNPLSSHPCPPCRSILGMFYSLTLPWLQQHNFSLGGAFTHASPFAPPLHLPLIPPPPLPCQFQHVWFNYGGRVGVTAITLTTTTTTTTRTHCIGNVVSYICVCLIYSFLSWYLFSLSFTPLPSVDPCVAHGSMGGDEVRATATAATITSPIGKW